MARKIFRSSRVEQEVWSEDHMELRGAFLAHVAAGNVQVAAWRLHHLIFAIEGLVEEAFVPTTHACAQAAIDCGKRSMSSRE